VPVLFSAVISRLEKANAQVVTRSRSGSLAPKSVGDAVTAATGTGTTGKLEIVSGKATPEEIKEKMEQQLKMQRAAHQQKRALETLKVPGGQVLKVVPSTQQGELL
jgi:nucleosome-remodeling factor subunit BPTF